MIVFLLIIAYILCCLSSIFIFSKGYILKFHRVSVGDLIFFSLISLFGPISLVSSLIVWLADWINYKNYDFLNKTVFEK